MAKLTAQAVTSSDRVLSGASQVAVIVGASLFVALCARITVPLPFTPVPLTLQNFAVLLVGLLLGARKGFAVLSLYLAEGMMGLPVFSPIGPGGFAQLVGPTGGFLLAYPFVAGVAGLILESGKRTFGRAILASFSGEVVLFLAGLSWLAILTHSFSLAIRFGLYWFVFAEIIKIMMAAAFANSLARSQRASNDHA